MILVTGGTGFLGATLIRQLLAAGQRIRATKRSSSLIPVDLAEHPSIEWVEADILNFFELQDAFEGIHQVYHCAALVSFDPADKKKLLRINAEGTAHIVNLCIDYQARLLYISSIAAIGYPKPGAREADEQDMWEFDGTQHGYAISKYEAEMEVWRGTIEGLEAVILNPSLIIGYQSGTKGSGAIFKLLKNGLNYYTDGSVGLVDVEDVAKAAILLMNNEAVKNERFIINNENISYKNLFTLCSSYLRRPAPKKKATHKMLGVAWRAAKLRSWFTGETPSLTRDTAHAALKKQAFSNIKLKEKTNFAFKPLAHTLKEICEKI
ncbi:NAD-dependent epimerase/dehydratase family protein [Olivibacter sp. SDN3]|uniref:NAD-dependent epimerase/dehydratase family protein n=1 Tax=Olivibacter sp. SDN3 TaxID=2764720 RepID=UPI00165100F5|nr:NAD-dependent epimerase/dehydratase family protein [Olivibacter sp. SDN3]QNL50690.1 NAD-dependent epimerase/dehydratase family protein [Olivibacter sp. SDN3]